MKANELMIGDWVYSSFCDVPCRVLGIEVYEATNGYGRVYVENVEEWKDVFSLTEIPLTPEIFEKNGFKLDKEDGWWWLTPKIGITFWEEGDIELEFENKHSSVDIQIKYLHQLQHALRLCGIEKNIEL